MPNKEKNRNKKTKQYKTKRNGIQEEINILKEKGNNSNMRWEEIKDFEDGEFYGFCTDFEQEKERIQDEIRKGCEIRNTKWILMGKRMKNTRKLE